MGFFYFHYFVSAKKSSHAEESTSVHSMSFSVTEDDEVLFEKSEFHRGQYETRIEQLENQTYGGMGIRDFTARSYGNQGIIQVEQESEVITGVTTRRMEGDEGSSGSESSDEFDKLESMKSKIEYMAKMYEVIEDVSHKRTHDAVDGHFTEFVEDKDTEVSDVEIKKEESSFSKKGKFEYEESVIENKEQESKFSDVERKERVTVTKEEITTKEEMEIKTEEQETELTKMVEVENIAEDRKQFMKMELEDIKMKKEVEIIKEEEEDFKKIAASKSRVTEIKEESITAVKEEIKIKEEIQERIKVNEEELVKMVGFEGSVSETENVDSLEVKLKTELDKKTQDRLAEVVGFESSVSETTKESKTRDSLELNYKSDIESSKTERKDVKASSHFDSSVETTEISTQDETEKNLLVSSSSKVESTEEEESSHLDASVVTMETKSHDHPEGVSVTSMSNVENKETVSSCIEASVETMESETHDQNNHLLLAESEIKIESSKTVTETNASEMNVSVETSSTENVEMIIEENKQNIHEVHIDQKLEEADYISELDSSSAECEILETNTQNEQCTVQQLENKADEIALESDRESHEKLSPLSPKEKSPVTASEKTEVGAFSKLEELTTSPAVETHELAEESFLDSSISKEEVASTSLGQDSGIFDMSLRDSLLRGDESLIDSSLNESADVLDESSKEQSAVEETEKEEKDLASKQIVVGHTREITEDNSSFVEEKPEVEVQKVDVSEEKESTKLTEVSEFSVMKADEIISEALAERAERISREDVAMAIEKLAVGDSVDPVEFSSRGAEARETETRTEEIGFEEQKDKTAELQIVEEQRPTFVDKTEEEKAEATSRDVRLLEGSDLKQTTNERAVTDDVTYEHTTTTTTTEDKTESVADQQELDYEEETMETVKVTVNKKSTVSVEKQTDSETQIHEQMSSYTEVASFEDIAALTELGTDILESAEATMADTVDLQKSAVGEQTKSHSDTVVEQIDGEREETADLDGMQGQASEVTESKHETEREIETADVSGGLVLHAEGNVESKQTASDKGDDFTVKSEVEISESQKPADDDEEGLRLRTEVGVSETEYRDELKISSLEVETDSTLAPPTIVSVSEDVSVKAGETIHLSSEVQGQWNIQCRIF